MTEQHETAIAIIVIILIVLSAANFGLARLVSRRNRRGVCKGRCLVLCCIWCRMPATW